MYRIRHIVNKKLSFAQKEFKQWSSQVLKETVDFIKKKAPEENTITPYWNRNY
jgi:hypothetical protein